jgi:aspartate/methionine/tyrosine aminotransferase
MHTAARMDRMGTEASFRVLARARALEAEGRDVIHLEMGEPDFPTPPHVVEAAIRALHDGRTGYVPAAGLPRLREAIARDVAASRGIPVDPAQVVVCPGGKAVIFFTYLALLEAGDEVVLPDPGFPIFASMADALGAVRRPYDPGSGTSRRPDLEALAASVGPRTRLVVLNSPGNPTGVVHTPQELAAIAEACLRHDTWVLSDEIYSRILFGREHRSVAALDGMAERTILLDGFSKTFCMTGWRLGYAVAPLPLAPLFERLMVNSASCAVSFVQHAALAALEGPNDHLQRMVAAFRARRDVLVDGLASIPGVSCDRPEGSFFVFADVRGTGRDARALADALLEEAGVACVEGPAFGAGGAGHLRFSVAAGVERIAQAVERMRSLLRG